MASGNGTQSPVESEAMRWANTALSLLSDGPWICFDDGLWSKLTEAERTEIRHRATMHGMEVHNEG